ncbi:hypothetical protein BFW38_05125 [Terasakiispira papahanaumokuakeensis]|uniref:JmjC domain-containing protein n=1 Tax=Terasakiispira papahanaumokuakeensis TaxID=197479 RepID=A0A1E2V7M7_9GAMM|nr:cupin domain-containing protein [Terasakiispira papahanaumokuakeensis]ODC03018.1 hypothetical protein BFW38_05125 [Terasakiispira papahanaumokuakeensis]
MLDKRFMAEASLKSLLEIDDVDCFLDKLGDNKPCLIPNDGSSLGRLISYDDVAQLLKNSRHCNPGVRLAKNGNIIPHEEYTYSYSNFQGEAAELLCHKAIYDCFLDGATIIYDNIEERLEKLLKLIQSMEYLLEEYCSAHLYVSKEEESGLDIHWDDHDVLVLQIHGQKKWTLYEKDIKYPVRSDRLRNPGMPGAEIWSGVLDPGNILYLPRGYWHLPEATGEICCHISIAIDRKIGKQYIHWLMNHLSDELISRVDVPSSSSENHHLFTSKISQMLNEAVKKNGTKEYRNALMLHSRPRQFYDFVMLGALEVEKIIEEEHYYFNLESRFPLNIESDDHQVWFYQCSKKFSYPIYAKGLLVLLVESAWVDFSDIQKANQGKCTREEIKSLMIGLIHEGVARVQNKQG